VAIALQIVVAVWGRRATRTEFARSLQNGAWRGSGGSRKGLATPTRPSATQEAARLVRDALVAGRPTYSHSPDALIAASQVVAIEFATIAAANEYGR